jgi:DNA-binding MarR family transcriptional regulator
LADADPDSTDAIGVIEVELAKLVRHLETFGRRSSLYARVDRAGYLAMRVLEKLGPVSAHDLARALRLDASTVTRQITALARQGLVERRANPADARSSLIVLTADGLRAMHEVRAERRRHIEALVRDWDPAGQAVLGAALTRLNASLLESVSQPEQPAAG